MSSRHSRSTVIVSCLCWMALVGACVGGYTAWQSKKTTEARERLAMQPDPAYFSPEPTTLPPRELALVADAPATCAKRMPQPVKPRYELVNFVRSDGTRLQKHFDRETGNYDGILANASEKVTDAWFIRRFDSISYVRPVNGSWAQSAQETVSALEAFAGHPLPAKVKAPLVGPDTYDGHDVCKYRYEGTDAAGSKITVDILQNGYGMIERTFMLKVTTDGLSSTLETTTQPMAPFVVDKPV